MRCNRLTRPAAGRRVHRKLGDLAHGERVILVAGLGALHAHQARHQVRAVVLVADVDRGRLGVRTDDVARHLQAPDRLADARRAADHQEIARPQPAVDHVVQRGVAGGHRAQPIRRAAGDLGFHLHHHVGEAGRAGGFPLPGRPLAAGRCANGCGNACRGCGGDARHGHGCDRRSGRPPAAAGVADRLSTAGGLTIMVILYGLLPFRTGVKTDGGKNSPWLSTLSMNFGRMPVPVK